MRSLVSGGLTDICHRCVLECCRSLKDLNPSEAQHMALEESMSPSMVRVGLHVEQLGLAANPTVGYQSSWCSYIDSGPDLLFSMLNSPQYRVWN